VVSGQPTGRAAIAGHDRRFRRHHQGRQPITDLKLGEVTLKIDEKTRPPDHWSS
jgi:hypothetical protein